MNDFNLIQVKQIIFHLTIKMTFNRKYDNAAKYIRNQFVFVLLSQLKNLMKI